MIFEILMIASLFLDDLLDAGGCALRVALTAARGARRAGNAHGSYHLAADADRHAAGRGGDVGKELRADRNTLGFGGALAVVRRRHAIGERGIGLAHAVLGAVRCGAIVAHRGLHAPGWINHRAAHLLPFLPPAADPPRPTFHSPIPPH